MSLSHFVAPLFVLLWSTGFIGAKLGLPHAEPMTFLALRFAIAGAVLAAWVVLSGAPWPDRRQLRDQVVIGCSSSSSIWAASSQRSTGGRGGLSALIVGLQPIATALIARQVLGERLVAVQWAGMVLGLGGVALVVTRKLGAGIGDPLGVLLCVAALLGIAAGSILQKSRAGATPMRSGNGCSSRSPRSAAGPWRWSPRPGRSSGRASSSWRSSGWSSCSRSARSRCSTC